MRSLCLNQVVPAVGFLSAFSDLITSFEGANPFLGVGCILGLYLYHAGVMRRKKEKSFMSL